MKLIYLKGRYYLLSTDDIKKGDVFLCLKQHILLAENDINVHDNTTHYKIIAASKEYNFEEKQNNQILNYNIPLLDRENIEALLPNGFDVDSLANEYAENQNSAYTNDYYGFKSGFKKHKELTSDKKWTDADIIEAMRYAMNKCHELHTSDEKNLNIHLYLDRINQKNSEWDVEIELENNIIELETPNKVSDYLKPKLTTNGYITITKIK